MLKVQEAPAGAEPRKRFRLGSSPKPAGKVSLAVESPAGARQPTWCHFVKRHRPKPAGEFLKSFVSGFNG